jgi:hypothetical protein
MTTTTKKHVITRLDRHGDTETKWDPNDAVQVKAAEDVFNALMLGTETSGRHLMSTLADPDKPHGDLVEIKKFDPDATEIFATPQLVGG